MSSSALATTIVPPAESTVPLNSFARGQSAAEYSFQALRSAILGLTLTPGTVLSRSALATRLGVSQTPVREALIRLQEETLIEVVPHSATRVARIDVDNARQAHFLRMSVELEIVRRLASGQDPEFRSRLEHSIGHQRAMLARRDEAGLSAADSEFHSLLYEAAGVSGLRDLVRSRSGHLDRLRRLHLPTAGKMEAVLAEHEKIVEALLANDPDLAQGALRRHLSHTFGELDLVRARHPDFF